MARRGIALGTAVLTGAGVLSILAAAAPAGAAVSPGLTTRASVADDGSPQGPLTNFFYSGALDPSISADGRFVAFDTQFPLDPLDRQNDTDPAPKVPAQHESDIYLRDRTGNHTALITRGEPAPPPPRFSYAAAAFAGEAAANGNSVHPSISADGRYVAFATAASNLPAAGEQSPGPDQDHAEIVVCDRDPDGDGVFDEHASADPNSALAYRYTVVSVQHFFQPPGDGEFLPPPVRVNNTFEPSLTVNRATGVGEVAYGSWDDNTPTAPRPQAEVFVARFTLAANGQVDLGSLDQVNASQAAGDLLPGLLRDGAGSPALSRDGTQVAYGISYHVFNGDETTTFGTAVLSARLIDRDGFQAVDPARLDVDAAGAPLPGFSGPPSISGDGREVAFAHTQDQFGRPPTQALVVDRDPDRNGTFGPATPGAPAQPFAVTVASRNNAGGDGNGDQPALSADGRYVAFSTSAANMHNGVDDDSGTGPCVPVINFAPGDNVNCSDIVVRDLVVDAAREQARLPRLPGELASPGTRRDCLPALPAGASCEGDGASQTPVLSDDGSLVAYQSQADDLLPGAPDGNGVGDVFVREFRPTLTAAELDLGTVDVTRQITGTVVFSYTGFGPLAVGAATLDGGAAAAGFALVPGGNTCTGATLFEGDRCGVEVAFTPQSARPQTATLTVTPLGAGRAAVPATVKGNVNVPPAGFRADPNPVQFGQHPLLTGTGALQTAIGNTGRTPFTIDAVSLPAAAGLVPGDYRITFDDCVHRTLSGTAGCRIQVTFTPHGTGTRDAVLQILTTQAFTGQTGLETVHLTGSAPAAAVQVNPGVVASGRVTSITGQGFAPGHPVVLTISGFPVTLAPAALPDGSFTAPLIVFPHTTPGTHLVQATVAGTPVSVSAPVLVVPGSAQPPGFEIRR
jgi:hypothetical protein